jgi:DNA-binding PadR family transcriptional regulator
MYELMILSLLVCFPMHGYLIAKIINDILGPFAKISNGTFYPLLCKLRQAKLIAAVDEEGDQQPGDHRARAFVITEEGRKRLHQLMLDTSSNQGDYQKIFQYKVGYLYLLKPQERLHLLNHYINYCQAQILYYKAEAEDFIHEHGPESHPDFVENVLDVMNHKADLWQRELEWVQQVRARESARIEREEVQQTLSSAERSVEEQ